MGSRSLSQLGILGLLLVGGISLSLRSSARQAEKTALEDSLWKLAYQIDFKATGDKTAVRVALPNGSDHLAIENESFTPPGVPGVVDRVVRLRPSGTRELVVETNRLGDFSLNAEFLLRLRPGGGWGDLPLMNLTGDTRAWYLREQSTTFPTNSREVRELVRTGEAETESEGALLQWIFDHCLRELEPASADASDTVLGSLRDGVATPLGKARLMVTLCRAAGLPARLVTGFELRQQTELVPHTWVEVFRDARWLPFDPVYGHARRLPDEFVAARRDGQEVVRTPSNAAAEQVASRFSILRLGPPSSILDRELRHPSQVFDLTRLPVEMHKVLSVLLLLPLGALITAFFRNLVGIPTFGTFAPALFAVSFIYADWGTGLLILVVVVLAGLGARKLVGRLRLLMVPRLSIILTTIILCVVFGVSALDYLALTPSAKAVLLPLVIVTILIERFYVTAEEDGIPFAMQLSAGTLVVAAVCYMVLGWDKVGQAILIYPEFHLITIALFIAIGRYAGYRLIELWRFRDMVQKA
ncbi:MAG: 7TM domain-containing protein [Planctomycetota bacterium]